MSKFSPYEDNGGTSNAVLACAGMHADSVALAKLLKRTVKWYKFDHGKTISTKSIAAMLHVTLYKKRFFPFYVFNIIGGLDENGKGAVYAYDPVGSYELVQYKSYGSAAKLVQPFLDNQVAKKNQDNADLSPITLESAKTLIKDAFIGATERDIYTGDFLEMHIITKDGVKTEISDLKRD